ncbi:MAG: adenosine kinase [Myxococcales bacterium]|nr:adenosine kinase [Myxococcales bacterium]
MTYDAIGLGNAIMDALVRIEDDSILAELGLTRGQMHPVDHARWVEVFLKVRPLGVEFHSGGSCANTIATIGLCGANVLYRGQVGADEFGTRYAQSLNAACGGHALHIDRDLPTGKCLSLISQSDAERTMLTDLGASIHLGGLGPVAEMIATARLFHTTGYKFLGGPIRETAFAAMSVAEEHQVPISFDVADPFVARTIRADVEAIIKDHATIAFLNREEAQLVTGKGIDDAIEELMGWTDIVIVKLGSAGSVVLANGKRFDVPVFPATVTDTTGAGDTYAGGFLYGWLRGLSPGKAGELGARIAALTVGQVGAVVRDRARIAAIKELVGVA